MRPNTLLGRISVSEEHDLKEREMSTAKLAIMILIMAALLFVVAPQLSWGKCGHRTNHPARLTTLLLPTTHGKVGEIVHESDR